MFPNMNIALHLRREVLNYKLCIETCTCNPKRWKCCNIDACKNIKNKALFVYYSEMWHLAQYVWNQTSIRPGRMTDSSPLHKEMEFHIISSSFVIIIIRLSYLICRYVFFIFHYFSLQIYTFPFYFVLFCFIFSFFCSSSCFFFSRFFLLSRSFLSIFLFYLSVFFLSSCFVSPSFVSSPWVGSVSL